MRGGKKSKDGNTSIKSFQMFVSSWERKVIFVLQEMSKISLSKAVILQAVFYIFCMVATSDK